ncbi:MAG: type I methionyl aminopeptidase [Bradymonadaceae bacterium]|nr:type I methionyl aminopeptidase [Lujinxingiaceae bacterium]
MARTRIELKSSDEIAVMARAGAIVCEVLDTVESHAMAGISTFALDEIARDVMSRHGATSAFLNYPHDRGGIPFPGVLCTSVNEAIVHGIPSREQVLVTGDVVTIDFGCVFEGFYGDSARTIAVGEVSPEVQHLLEITRQALDEAIAQCGVDRHLHEIGAAVERIVRPHGYGIVAEFVGHGIGRSLHEDPQVPNYVPKGYKACSGLRLEPGLVMAIEPMVNLGTARTKRHKDGWTIITADGLPSAHFEHTVAITEDGPIVLTSRT